MGPADRETVRVLFLCTHNSARSQMAEAFLRRYGGPGFEAFSAGLAPTSVHPFTRRVLEEVGIDTGDLRAKGVNAFLGKTSITVAIVVCEPEDEGCPRVYPFAARTLYWPFKDPVDAAGSPEEQLAVFRRVRDEIANRIRRFLMEGA